MLKTDYIFNFDNLPKPALMIILGYIKKKKKDRITTLLISKYILDFALRWIWHPWSDGLILACRNGYTEYYIKWSKIAGTRWDPSVDYNNAIRLASKNGHIEIVKILLQDKRVDPTDNWAIRIASQFGHIEIVKILLEDKRVDPSADDNYAIQYASQNGHTAVVKLLLHDDRVNPAVCNNYSIKSAIENGYTETIKILLQDKRVDPSVDNNYAIRFASYNGHTEIVKLLLQKKINEC